VKGKEGGFRGGAQAGKVTEGEDDGGKRSRYWEVKEVKSRDKGLASECGTGVGGEGWEEGRGVGLREAGTWEVEKAKECKEVVVWVCRPPGKERDKGRRAGRG